MLQAVIYCVITVILTKELVKATDQERQKQFWIDPAVVWGFIWLVVKGNSAAMSSSR